MPAALRAASAPAPARVTCVGMSGLDRIMRVSAFASGGGKIYAHDYAEAGGGPAATAAVAVQRLGGAAQLVARVGADASGAAISAELAQYGVDLRLLRALPGACSGLSQVVIDSRGERQITHYAGRGLDVDADWLDARALAGSTAVLADMGWRRGAQRAFALAAAAEIPTVLDADLSPDPRAQELLALADHVLFSEAALRRSRPQTEPERALRELRAQHGAAKAGVIFGVTLGAQGYLWLEGERLQHIPGHPVAAVDTLGAGDVFHGAYALALAEGRSAAAAAAFANAAAALKCTRTTGRAAIPLRAEVDSWLASCQS